MNRKHARRRGYIIGEMIVTGGLLTLAATLAASMTIRLFQTGYSLRVDEQAGLKIDAAVRQLRRDIEPSGVLPVKGGVLTTDAAKWKVRDDTLVRTGTVEQTFGPLPTPIELKGRDGTVEVRIGQANWTIAQLTSTGGGQ